MVEKKKIDINSEKMERMIDKVYDGFDKKDMSREEFRSKVKEHVDKKHNS